MNNIFDRIGKVINIKKLSCIVCDLYELNEYKSYRIIKIGCDDFSFYLETRTGQYVVKILHRRKNSQDIKKFEDTYNIFMKNKIKCPHLLKNRNEEYISKLQFGGININLCLLEYINGKDLYSMNKKITNSDIDKLVDILVSIHNIKDNYKIEYDRYSFMKLKEVFEKHKSILSKKMSTDVANFLKEYAKVDFNKLPVCFIHADLGRSNIIKSKNNELFVIDFIQSGTGIRLLDIVIIINRCIFNYNYVNYSKKMEKYFLKKYQQYIKLTEYELEVLSILEKANAYSFAILEYAKLNSKQKRINYKNDLKFIKKGII